MKFLKFTFLLVIGLGLFKTGEIVGKIFVEKQEQKYDIRIDDNKINKNKSLSNMKKIVEDLKKEDITLVNKSKENMKKTRMFVVKVDSMGLREYHSFNSKVVVSVYKGEKLKKIDYFDGWYRVLTANGDIGWTKKKWLSTRTVEIPDGSFQEVYISLTNNNLKNKVKYTATKFNAPVVVTRVKIGTIKFQYDNSYKAVEKIYRGDIFSIFAYYNGWFKVKLKYGGYGWTQKENVYGVKGFENDGSIIYSLKSAFKDRFAPISKIFISSRKFKILSGPGYEYNSLKEIVNTGNYECYGEIGDWYFIYIESDDIAGWVSKKISEVLAENNDD